MMKELFGEYIVEYNSAKVGLLTVSEHGLMARFTCQCVVATAEVLRLAILSGDRYIPLGVLLPEGDKLHFAKQFSKNDLRMKGLSSIDGCRLVTSRDTLTAEPRPMPIPEPMPEPTPEPEPIPEPIPAPEPEPIPPPEPEPIPQPALTPESELPPTPVGDGVLDVPPDLEPDPNPFPEPEWESIEELDDRKAIYTHAAIITADPPSVADENPDDIDPYPVIAALAPEPEPMPTAPWTAHPDPGLLFLDPDLIAACANISGAMTRPCGNDCIALAVPFESGKPFPLMPVFCFGKAEEVNGRSHLVFQIKNGILVS